MMSTADNVYIYDHSGNYYYAWPIMMHYGKCHDFTVATESIKPSLKCASKSLTVCFQMKPSNDELLEISWIYHSNGK